MSLANTKVLALSGGVGGAKLALGLYHILAADQLTIVANTADDFEHFGLFICPDLDTLMYTLSGLSNQQTGWGRSDETWTFMQAMATLGGEDWFNLGDGDLATHIERSRRLQAGENLSQISAFFCQRLAIQARLLPMSNDPVQTMVQTTAGTELLFQHYFVKQRCAPVVSGFRFAGIATAQANPLLLEQLADPELSAVIICPSNPFISIDPIVHLPGVRDALRACAAPVIAISPIIGGAAIKGPTAKMMTELGMAVTASSVAHYYQDFLDAYVLDHQDATQASALTLPVVVAQTLMTTLEDRIELAEQVLAFAHQLSKNYASIKHQLKDRA